MRITLPGALSGYVARTVNGGRYQDASEVIREALRRMEAADLAAELDQFDNAFAGGHERAEICGNEDDFFTEHPTTAELVIEVCVSSHEYHRSKLRAYASAGVKECWLVLGPEKQIEGHRQPQGGQFVEHAVHGPGGTLTSAVVSGFTVELDRLFTA